MTKRLLVASFLLVAVAPAGADAPLAPPLMRVCSLDGTACASRDPSGRMATVWRKAANRRSAKWRVRIASPRLDVSDDGRALVEIYPGLTLLDPDAGPATIVLVFHRPDRQPVSVRLRDVIANIARLPSTASHRQWARAFGFDGRGSFLLETVEGRSIRFDPASGLRR